MDETGVMRGEQSFTCLHEHRDDVAPRPGMAIEPAGERVAAHELHHDEDLVVDRADLVHADDVRVREPRHRLRLGDQPHARGGARVAIAHDLDRDTAIEIGIVSLEHDTHPAGAELAHDPEVTDRRAWRERRQRLDAIALRSFERALDDHAGADTSDAR